MLEKQGSGLNLLNFETTPMNKHFEVPMKDSMDQFSFSIRSKDDPFINNQGFADYSFANLEVKCDKTPSKLTSPMTRNQRTKEIVRLKQTIQNASPERFTIDWDKIELCPCCRQKMPDNKAQINRSFFKAKFDPNNNFESPSKSRKRKSRFDGSNKISVNTLKSDDNSESEVSEYKAAVKSNNVLDDISNKRRKSKTQIKMLETELDLNPHWTNDDMLKIAK